MSDNILDEQADDDFPAVGEIDPKERIADWVAGDLEGDEAAEIAQMVAVDPELAKQAALCRVLQDTLVAAAHPAHVRPPGVGMAEVLRQRLRSEQPASVQHAGKPLLHFIPRVAPWLVTAAACLLALFTVFSVQRQAAGPNVYYDEYGAMVQPVSRLDALPQKVSRSSISKPANTSAVENRPWMGVWTKPIALEGFDRAYGLLVVQIAESGPAAQAGLMPGDVILDIGSMPLSTRWCLPHALADYRPEQTVTLNYWREGQLQQQQTSLTLGHCLE